jgi:hypothetical protein
MSLIGMLESFFILSLGITFVLVLFLVYHFKQRLAILENKCDTTFEIINNVVSELGNIRGAFRLGGAPPTMPAPAQSPPRQENAKINVTISDDDHEVSDYDDDAESEDDDTDDDGDGDEESDGDGDDEESDGDDEDSDGDDNPAHNVAESGDDDDVGENGVDNANSGSNNDSNTVRIINLDNQQEFDIIETVEDLNAENGNRDDQVDDDVSHIENMEEIQLHVEKLPTGEHHLDDSSIASSVAESKNNSHIYKKMTLPVLKAYVIEKGLVSDPSKMKKQELIHLIESSDI